MKFLVFFFLSIKLFSDSVILQDFDEDVNGLSGIAPAITLEYSAAVDYDADRDYWFVTCPDDSWFVNRNNYTKEDAVQFAFWKYDDDGSETYDCMHLVYDCGKKLNKVATGDTYYKRRYECVEPVCHALDNKHPIKQYSNESQCTSNLVLASEYGYFNPACVTCDDPVTPSSDFILTGQEPYCNSDEVKVQSGDLYKCELKSPENTDSDGDGIPDKYDDDFNNNGFDGNRSSTECLGDSHHIIGRYGNTYSRSDYKFFGAVILGSCADNVFHTDENGNSLGLVYCDAAYDTSDLNPNCNTKYCYIHDNSQGNCNYSASDRAPRGYIYRSDLKSESTCMNEVDNVIYSSAVWDVPSSNCPGVSFCFLKVIYDSDDNNDSADNNIDSIDLNQTSSDNQALLDSQNKSNKNLNDIKDKIDISNKNLEDLKNVNTDILNSNKDIKASVDIGNKRLEDISDELRTANNNLSDLSNRQNSTNKLLSKLNNTATHDSSNLAALVNSNQAILDELKKGISVDSNGTTQNDSNITVNADFNDTGIIDKLTAGLFGDDDLDTNVTDGLSDSVLSGYESNITSNFDILEESNIFGLSNIASSDLPTFSFSFYGATVTIFEPSMLNNLPIDSVRSLLLLFAALVGFAHTFRSI